jgi:ankyrin repeat protein
MEVINGVDELNEYLASGGDINAVTPVSGWSLLHCAVENQNLELIQLLAKYGANLNAKDIYGTTPLHLAVDIDIDGAVQNGENVSFETTQLLLSLGADEFARDKKGRTPRDWANRSSQILALYESLNREAEQG